MASTALEFRSTNKRARERDPFVEPMNKTLRRRSFESAMRTNLSAEAGIKPLSPEKNKVERKSGSLAPELHGEFTPEMFRSERDLARFGIYMPRVEPFPENFFLFKNRSAAKEYEKKEDLFSRLPDEMILKVLHWLPKTSLGVVSRVNKRLSRLSRDETLWKRVDVSHRTLSDNHLNVIFSRKPICARFSHSNMTSLIPEMTQDCSQLTHLDLTVSQIDPNILALIFRAAPNISHLSLEHLTLNEVAVGAMNTFAQKLQVLNLAMAYDLPAVTFASFLNKALKLDELNISCIKQNWSSSDLKTVVSALPVTLDQLNISGFRTLMTDSLIKIISTRCPMLTHLDVADCQELTQSSVEVIAVNLKYLQHLSLSRCYNIEAVGYAYLQSAKSLRKLELFSLFRENSIRTLAATIPGVQINTCILSTIARPTVGIKRSSIWNKRVRD